MNCEKCGRPLEAHEKKLCPHCKNKQNTKIKRVIEIGGGLFAIIAAVLIKLLGEKKGDKS